VGLAIEGANRHDMKLVRPTLESIPAAIEERRQKAREHAAQGLCLDKAYDYDQVRALVEEFGFAAHIRARGEEKKALAQEPGFRARRWVVERTHSWMNRFRRILIRWEKKAQNYLAMLHFACACITCKRCQFG
jgi:transposase